MSGVQLLKELLTSRPGNCVETRDKEIRHTLQQRFLNCVPSAPLRVAVVHLFEALCYKPPVSIPKNVFGIFHWQNFRRPCGPGVHSACNRSEYQEYIYIYRVIQNDCRGVINLSYTIHLILHMQPRVISFHGVTSRIRFMFLLFQQLSRNRRLLHTTNSCNELEYRVDVCRITKGAHIEHL